MIFLYFYAKPISSHLLKTKGVDFFIEDDDLLGDSTMTETLFDIFIPNRDIEQCQTWSNDTVGSHAESSGDVGIFNIKPSDVKIVMAFGDSISAGFGANSSSLIYNPTAWKEYRGQSFSMGGDVGAKSIANFLSHYHLTSPKCGFTWPSAYFKPFSVSNSDYDLASVSNGHPYFISKSSYQPGSDLYENIEAHSKFSSKKLPNTPMNARTGYLSTSKIKFTSPLLLDMETSHNFSDNSNYKTNFGYKVISDDDFPGDGIHAFSLADNATAFPSYSRIYQFWNPFARPFHRKLSKDKDTDLELFKCHPLGSSKGTRYLRMCIGGWCPPSPWLYNPKIDNLNAAISGSESDALELQFEYVKTKMEILANSTSLNISNEWKMATIFIGMNDVCSSDCKNAFPDNPNSVGHPLFYKNQIMKLLQRLSETFPKTVVNLIQLFDASSLDRWTQGKERCSKANWLHRYFCSCSRSEAGRKTIQKRIKIYNEMLYEIWLEHTIPSPSGIGRIPARNDFALILSPTLTEIDLENDIPIEFLSRLDCFHPSLLGQQSLAIALWNDLFRRHDEKHKKIDYPLSIYCPTASDRIQVV